MLQAELKILGGKHQGKAIPLSTKKFLVGREQDCHLRPNSDLVSRHHCVFSIDEYAIRLRDLGSTNGTRVNGKPLHGEVILKSGDQIGIGKLELELVLRQRTDVVAPESQPLAPTSLSSGGLSSGELDIASSLGTVEIAPTSPAMPVSSETSFEMPVMPPLMPMEDTSTNLAGDTAIVPGTAPAQFPGYQPAQPGFPQMPAGYPAGYTPGYPPQGYQMPPMGYLQQMGYPQQYPQQYPQGYMPQAYPGMPGYPPQMQYPAGYAAPAMPTAAEPAAAPAAAVELAVKLPPPESTGVKTPPPAPAATPAASGAKTEEKPSNSAADIIKSYMQKRTR